MKNNIIYPPNGARGERDSAEEKVKSFIRDGMDLIAALRHLDSLDDSAAKNPIRRIVLTIAQYFNRWSLVSFVLTITINILLLISVESKESGNYYDIKGDVYHDLLVDLGISHLFFCSLTAASYTVMYGFLYVKNQAKKNPDATVQASGYYLSRFFYVLNRLRLLGGSKKGVFLNNTYTTTVWPVYLEVYYFFSNTESNYYYLLIVFSALGNFVHPIWYAFSLAEFFRIFKLMYYVTRAFTANIDQVIATVVLSALLMYWFTVISFYNPKLHNQFYFDDIGEDGCFSLESCYRTFLDYSSLMAIFWKDSGEISTPEGAVFNFFMVFILQIVLPGLVSGIIIDTFSQLREEKLAMEEDVANTCYICNINREDFETANISFVDHIRDDHNMWKYIWYIIYLGEKDPTEFDGTEQFCAELITEDNVPRMLPLKMARALSSVRDKYDLFTIYSKISALTQSVERIDSNLKLEFDAQEKSLRESFKLDVNNLQQTFKSQLGVLEKKLGKRITNITNKK